MMKNFFTLGVILCGLSLLVGCSNLMKAEMKLGFEQYDEAIPLLQQYLSKNPDSVEARSKLGFAYLKTGKIEDAIQEFESALQKQPGEPLSVLYLGIAYLNSEQYDKALKVWQTYRNKKKPLVEEEIKRLLTLVQVAESQQSAQQALAKEKSLDTKKTDQNTIAVCYYRDRSPDKSMNAFQKALAEMVISDLSKVQKLNVVERVKLQALLTEMKMGQTGIVDSKSAPRVGRLLGAENLVVGELTKGIQATTSLASANKETIKGTSSISVDEKNFFELPKAIVMDVTKILGIKLSDQEMAAIQIPQTKNYQAFIYFGEGLDAMDAGQWQKAKNLFDKAIAEDPDFKLAGERGESCPGPSSPSINQLQAMAASQISSQVEQSLSVAETAQREADQQAAEMNKEGGGGGGG